MLLERDGAEYDCLEGLERLSSDARDGLLRGWANCRVVLRDGEENV